MQDAPRVLQLPVEGRTPEAPHVDDVVELYFAVGAHVSPAACKLWLWLWKEAGYAPGLTGITSRTAGAICARSHVQGRAYVLELVNAGLATIVKVREGRQGGFDLRLEDAAAVLLPTPKSVRGDPQRPLFSDQNCKQNVKSLSVNSAPIIDQVARANSSSIIDQDHRTPMSADHDTGELNVSSQLTVSPTVGSGPSASPSVDDQRLAAIIHRRRREMRGHFERHPGDARHVRDALQSALPPADNAHEAQQRAQRVAGRHQLVREMIIKGVGVPDLPEGLVHDVADLVVADDLPERALMRILNSMRKLGQIKNRGAYFRRCIEQECIKRRVSPPHAPRGP